ncbi:MAG: hypothetical protein FJ253_11520, partial [Phycisphaerae bacterium]|nr:hypothetical protein [Phycisphaerae bacterium]
MSDESTSKDDVGDAPDDAARGVDGAEEGAGSQDDAERGAAPGASAVKGAGAGEVEPAAAVPATGAGVPMPGGAKGRGRGHVPPTLKGRALAITTLAALGVVFGDIGTSPLYAIKECAEIHLHEGGRAVDELFIRGILSLVFWSLVIVVCIKYLTIVMRATNRGEGGLFALLALVPRSLGRRSTRLVAMLGVFTAFGAGLLFGDGIITPSISVLSAVEGLTKVNADLKPAVVPVTLAILVMLFSVQQFGTGRIGAVFGPVMLVWFAVIGALGVGGIVQEPGIWTSANPIYAAHFVSTAPWESFVLLGSVFLVVTGVEALYADVGHFGIRSVRLAWYLVAFPALLLNYFGQGAHLLAAGRTSPEALSAAIDNPFYDLAPVSLRIPLVLIATLAAIIASQAMISGVFSVARQAVRLGYMPRIQVVHTSMRSEAQ